MGVRRAGAGGVSRRLARASCWILLALVLCGLWIWLRPLGLDALASRPAPADSREKAIQMWKALSGSDPSECLPICRMTLMDHGESSEWAIVLLHGFTNCPEQFRSLGTILHDAGCNVVIPRVPDHGMEDRMTDALADLSAEEMTELCDRAVDLAAGLGRRVAVVGLSSGGTMAAWVAQHREVERVLVISPVLGAPGLNPAFTRPAASFGLLWPNRFWWWDAELKEELPGPPYAYPRYATRGISEVLRLGLHVFGEASRSAPRARSIMFVVNGNDTAVNFDAIESLKRAWGRMREGSVESFEFPAEERLHHDLIDPLQVDAHIARVYPELISMILAEAPGAEDKASSGSDGGKKEAGPEG